MIDFLKLLGGLLVGVFQIACGSRSRDGISPPAASCLAAVGASKAQAAHCRSPDLRLVSRDNPLWGAPRHDGEHRQDKNCAHWDVRRICDASI
jgi:hypothetical protein